MERPSRRNPIAPALWAWLVRFALRRYRASIIYTGEPVS